MIRLALSDLSCLDSFASGRSDHMRLLDMVQDLDLDGVDLFTHHFPSTERSYLLALKERCLRGGLTIACIAVEDSFGNPPDGRAAQVEKAKRWIDHAATLGAPMVEVIAGWAPEGETEEAAWSAVVDCLVEVARCGRDAGVKVALQNHNHEALTRTGSDILRMMEEVGPEIIGHVLDTAQYAGSPGATGGTPTNADDVGLYRSIEQTARLALLVRAKLFLGGSRETGMRNATLDYERIFQILADARFNGFVSLVHWGLDSEESAIPRGVEIMRRHLQRLNALE